MAYQKKGWKFWVPTIAAAIGFLIGLAILICFVSIYKNFHVASWGGVSGILSGITLAMHLAVRFDHDAKLNPKHFRGFMIVGILGFLSGIGAFIGYLIKGIIEKETGIQVHGSFIVTIWSFMTFKWGMLLFLHGKNYEKELSKQKFSLLGSIQT